MSRNPSVDWVLLEREYVYGEPPPSLTELAEKHGTARSGLAAKAAGEKGQMSWFEKRKEFRDRLGEKTLLALADKWAAFETESREKMMKTANAALDAFIKDLADGKVKISSKDAVEWINTMRTMFEEIRNAGRQADVVDGQAVEMNEDEAKQAMAEIHRLLGSGTDVEPEPAT